MPARALAAMLALVARLARDDPKRLLALSALLALPAVAAGDAGGHALGTEARRRV